MTETGLVGAVGIVAAQLDLMRRLPKPAMRRALRVSSGLTGAQVADAIGVSRQAVAQWELGKRTPRGEHLRAYVEVLERLADDAREAS